MNKNLGYFSQDRADNFREPELTDLLMRIKESFPTHFGGKETIL
jgi:hypothetical protein